MKRTLNILGLISLFVLSSLGAQFGVETAKAAYWQWSKTPNNNATADPSINWSEGMSPSSVNDSGRAMMARAAEQRDDVSGLLTTGGTSTAYTVTTNQGLQTPTPVDGQLLGVTMNVTNGVNATLAADGGTAYPIQISPGVAAPAGTTIAGSPYTMRFRTASNAWMLRNYYGSVTVPLGAVLPYTLTTTPGSNFVFANGQCLSTTTYNAYWTAVGSPGVSYCSAGQFPVLDLRGRVAAGLDAMGGIGAANRLTSAAYGCGTAMTVVGASCGLEYHLITTNEMPSHYHVAGISDPGHTHTVNGASQLGIGYATGGLGPPATTFSVSTSNNATGVRVNSPNGLDTTYSAGGGTNHSIVQPTIGVTYIIRVL